MCNISTCFLGQNAPKVNYSSVFLVILQHVIEETEKIIGDYTKQRENILFK